jgi:CRISPR-associated protein Cas2
MADRAALYVIAYDITDDRRRRRVAERLESQAARVQQSVFEVRLTARAARTLMADLAALAGPDDSLRLYAIPDAALARCRAHGGPDIAGGGRYWLV